MAFSDILDAIALIVGGTRPDATNQPFFYSGSQTGDATGISGIKGCYSSPPENVNCNTPFAVLLMTSGNDGDGTFRGGPLLTQGNLFKEDIVRLQICIGRTDPENQYNTLADLRDLVPAAFAAKIGLSGAANVSTAFPQDYKFAHVTWGGTEYMCLEFRMRVHRDVAGQTFST